MTKQAVSNPIPLFADLDSIADAQHNPPASMSVKQRKDFQYTCEFLFSYRGSQATFNAYRREMERFLQWSWHIAKQFITEHDRTNIEQYIEFCQHPPIAWIGKKNVKRFFAKNGGLQANPEWRPFVAVDPKKYLLSPKAVQAIFAILSSYYNYLIQLNYVAANPVAQMRQKSKYIRKQQNKAIIRRLSELQWSYVIETAELMAQQDAEQHERTLFIMNALYGMYLRISELAASARWTPEMGDFQQDGDGLWWFTTVGKGNKERLITVSDAMLKALKRYRKSLHLPDFPSLGENTPLLTRNKGQGPIRSTRRIRAIVQQCFDLAVIRMQEDGFQQEAQQLKAATVHWLRHTGISEDVKIRPREHVRDDAGHSSSAITDKYIDAELRERHASGKKKMIKPD